MPKVSVILTSLNHDNHIREAIDSVLNQTFTDFELIIWDDASADNSWEVIQSYSDSRIKSFKNDMSRRGIYGMNKSIREIAVGEYIAIHHSDDVWDLEKLEKQATYLNEHSEVGAVFTWAQIINEHGTKLEEAWFNQQNKTRWQWLNSLFNEKNNLNHPSVLIRKNCYEDVGSYRFGLAQTADAEMWSRLLIKYQIHIIQEKLTLHRLFSNRSNTSGQRTDTAIRASNEWNVLRENFLLLNKFEDIVAVFPNLERFRNPAGFDHQFLLAMACLYECKQQSAWQLGLRWLFELLSDSSRADKIKMLYAFSYIDLIQLTAQFDVFSVEKNNDYALQAITIAEQSKVIVAKDIALTVNTEEIIQLNMKLEKKAEEIIQLSMKLEKKAEALINKERQCSKIIQSKWHRLGVAINSRPITLHTAKVITYLFVSLILPDSIRKKLYPILVTLRKREMMNQTKQILSQPVNESNSYIVTSAPSNDKTKTVVIHVIANFCTGGSSRLVVDLIEYMGQDYEHSVVTSYIPSPPAYVGINITEYRFPNDDEIFITHFSIAKPDFIHVHYWGDCDEPWYAKTISAAEKLGIPVVQNINTPITPYYSPIVKYYVYVSDYVRKEFGKTDSSHVTIYPGSDFFHFTREDGDQYAEDCIGMVYRLEHDKLNERAIVPFIRAVQKRPQTRVLIVGGGSLLETFQNAVLEAGVSNRFEFTGYVSYDVLPDLYRRLSIFVAPVWKESFGQVSPFAMNMKIPVVGYNIGALSEITANEAVLAEPENAEMLSDIIVRLLDSPSKRKLLGQLQHERAQNYFSLKAMIHAYESLYQVVTNRKDLT